MLPASGAISTKPREPETEWPAGCGGTGFRCRGNWSRSLLYLATFLTSLTRVTTAPRIGLAPSSPDGRLPTRPNARNAPMRSPRHPRVRLVAAMGLLLLAAVFIGPTLQAQRPSDAYFELGGMWCSRYDIDSGRARMAVLSALTNLHMTVLQEGFYAYGSFVDAKTVDNYEARIAVQPMPHGPGTQIGVRITGFGTHRQVCARILDEVGRQMDAARRAVPPPPSVVIVPAPAGIRGPAPVIVLPPGTPVPPPSFTVPLPLPGTVPPPSAAVPPAGSTVPPPIPPAPLQLPPQPTPVK